MTETSTSEISTSEMAGHLRQAHRQFKSFEKAAEIATMLADHEKRLQGLNANIVALKDEAESLDAACNDATKKLAVLRLDMTKAEENNTKKNSEAEEKIKTKLANAGIEAENIIANANNQVKATLERIVALKADEEAAKKSTGTANAQLAAAEKKVADFKAGFASS